jgi:hypothetical protein
MMDAERETARNNRIPSTPLRFRLLIPVAAVLG